MVAGEITTSAILDIPRLVRDVVKDIGYDDTDAGFDYKTCGVMMAVERQSPDIAQGVDGKGVYTKEDQGAGDQGMMFGYACDETPELMPMPIMLAHKLARRLAEVRKKGLVDFLRPDGKSQVTVRYDENNQPVAIDTVVLSTQHTESVKYKTLREAIMEEVIKPVLPARLVQPKTKYFINPTGRFVVGGPMGDSGLTGRKIIVDTYGGMGRHGGGAFSGKDPSKVDRSACYYARYIAKNLVAAGLARRCEVQLAYAIGVAEPVSLLVQTFGTGALPEAQAGQHRAGQLRRPPLGPHPRARPAPPHLPQDRRLRPLRPRRVRLHLGAHRQGRPPARRRPQRRRHPVRRQERLGQERPRQERPRQARRQAQEPPQHHHRRSLSPPRLFALSRLRERVGVRSALFFGSK